MERPRVTDVESTLCDTAVARTLGTHTAEKVTQLDGLVTV